VRAAGAIQNGKKMGPNFKLSPYQRQEAIRVNAGGSLVDMGRSCNVSYETTLECI